MPFIISFKIMTLLSIYNYILLRIIRSNNLMNGVMFYTNLCERCFKFTTSITSLNFYFFAKLDLNFTYCIAYEHFNCPIFTSYRIYIAISTKIINKTIKYFIPPLVWTHYKSHVSVWINFRSSMLYSIKQRFSHFGLATYFTCIV